MVEYTYTYTARIITRNVVVFLKASGERWRKIRKSARLIFIKKIYILSNLIRFFSSLFYTN